MMGDGIIDLHGFRALVDAAGYDGPIEVEILNPAIWDLPRAELMRHRRSSGSSSACSSAARSWRAARAGAAARRRSRVVAAEHGVRGRGGPSRAAAR